jgi:hypothetical protein
MKPILNGQSGFGQTGLGLEKLHLFDFANISYFCRPTTLQSNVALYFFYRF